MTTDATSTRSQPRSRKPRSRLGAIVGGLIVLAIIVFLILFRWNWLRGPLAHVISGKINRPVEITGNLEVHPWSFSPRATVNGLVIGNAPWAPRTPLASVPRLTVQVKILPLFQGKTILPLVEIDNARLDLLRDNQGRANWNFHPGEKPKPLKMPAINNLIIKDGAVRYNDVKHHLDFAGAISSNEQVNGHGQGSFVLDGKGSLNSASFLAHVTGGPLINVDPSRPLSVRRPRLGGCDPSAFRGTRRPPVQLRPTVRHDGGQRAGPRRSLLPDRPDLAELAALQPVRRVWPRQCGLCSAAPERPSRRERPFGSAHGRQYERSAVADGRPPPPAASGSPT